MHIVTLKNNSESGESLQASFSPEKGMNLTSLKFGGDELIDQNTLPLFEKRCAGLGALIGPHFHHRADENIPPSDFDLSLFPHIQEAFAKGSKEPFSHGIARYVPWEFDNSITQLSASLEGSHELHGVKIKDLEGFDFSMKFDAKLVHDGLLIDYKIVSESPSVIGMHYYYNYSKPAELHAIVKEQYRTNSGWKRLPQEWYHHEKHKLHLLVKEDLDIGFQPFLIENEHFNRITLENEHRYLHISYSSSNEHDSSWQLYHPKDSSFVCIEPLSALNPREPRRKASHLQVKISSTKKK